MCYTFNDVLSLNHYDLRLSEFLQSFDQSANSYCDYIEIQKQFIINEVSKLNKEYEELKKNVDPDDFVYEEYIWSMLQNKSDWAYSFLPTIIYKSTFLSIFAFAEGAIKGLYENFSGLCAKKIEKNSKAYFHNYKGAMWEVIDFSAVENEYKQITNLYQNIRDILIHNDGQLDLNRKYDKTKYECIEQSKWSKNLLRVRGGSSVFFLTDYFLLKEFLCDVCQFFQGLKVKYNAEK